MLELHGLERFSESERKKIKKAYDLANLLHAGTYRKSGEPYITHPIAVAQFLIDAQKDYQTICIGLLHDTIEDTDITYNELAKEFGRTIANGVDGVTKVKDISNATATKDQIMLATDRKFMTHLAKDIRVIDVKLADRYNNMLTKAYWPPETQKRKSQENFSVYAPVSKSVGAWRIKNFLEDTSFESLVPDTYCLLQEERQSLIAQHQEELREIGENIRDRLQRRYGITCCEIKPQFKNVYSLYEAIKIRDQKIFQLNDLLSLKVVLEKPGDCYSALGVTNDLYANKQVVDYIGSPKPNCYQSIHDIVTYRDKNKRSQDILIKFRTKLMDIKATYGMSVEDYRKKGGQKLFQGISLIDQTSTNDETFMERVQKEIFGEKVTVFTPTGERCELAKGATVVDFAFYIHTQLGLHMRGAIVNGMMVSNDYKLQNNDTVHIIRGEELINQDVVHCAQTFYARQMIENEIARSRKLKR